MSSTFRYSSKNKRVTFRINQMRLLSYCCVAWWVVTTCVFAGLFGWSYTRPSTFSSDCVEIRLLNDTSNELAHGEFDETGKECVFRSRLPDNCKALYAEIGECFEMRRGNSGRANHQYLIDRASQFKVNQVPLCVIQGNCPLAPPHPSPPPQAPPFPPQIPSPSFPPWRRGVG